MKYLFNFVLILTFIISFNVKADDFVSNEILLQRAALGDNAAQLLIGVNYFEGNDVEVNRVEAASWMFMAYQNSGSQDYQRIFAQHFHNITDAELIDVEQRILELEVTYGKNKTSQVFSPKLLSDIACRHNLPPKIIKREFPKYPEPLEIRGIIGSVDMHFTISKQGYPRDIEVDKYTHQSFIKASFNALERWEYEQADIHHKNTTIKTTYHIEGVNSIENDRRIKRVLVNAINNDVNAQFETARLLGVLKTHMSSSNRKVLNKWYKEKRGINHSPFQKREENHWLYEAAKNGHAQAQFQLGMNMLLGRGCEVDEKTGSKWLQASANQNFLPAKALAGENLLKNLDIDSHKAAISLLTEASHDVTFRPKIELAWVLSTSRFETLRNPKLALDLLDDRSKLYRDNVRLLETEAAAYAALGDFDEAQDLQEDAIDEAKDLGWTAFPDMLERLKQYKANKMVVGDYYL